VGRYADKHSQEQRDAVIRAQLEDGISAEEAVELAAAGQLYELEPFDISPSMVRELRREVERERPTNGGPKTELDRARAIAEATIARIEAMESPSAKDLHAARQAAQIIRDADREQEKQAARKRASQPRPTKQKVKCRRLLDEYAWPDDAVSCSCPDEPPCVFSKVAPEMEAERLATDKALGSGGTCQCRQPRPRGWCLDRDGNPTCETCRLTIEGWQTRFPGIVKDVERSRLIAAGKIFEEALALTEALPAH
jgi:hypothetical protein